MVQAAIFEVTGHEAHALGVIPVGQRYARIAGGGTGSGNTGDHLEGNMVPGQQLDFLAAPTEDKRIAALEAHYPLALLGHFQQQCVDLLLWQAVVGAGLAHVDALGIAPGQLDDGRRHQAIIEHHIRALQQAQGLERQQVGITGTGAQQVDLPPVQGAAVSQLALQQLFGLLLPARQHQFRHGAVHGLLPEQAARCFTGDRAPDNRAHTAGEQGQAAIGRGQHGLESPPQGAHQYRAVAATGNRYGQRRAVDYGGKYHRAQFGSVHHVDGQLAGLRIPGHLCVDRVTGRGGHDQHCPLDTTAAVFPLLPAAASGLQQRRQFRLYYRRHYQQASAGLAQQPRLAGGDLPAAHQQHGAVGEPQADWKEVQSG